MKFFSLLISLIIYLASSLYAQTTPVYGIREKTPDIKAFTGAKIIISPDVSYENASLVIKDGKIVNIGINIEIPPDALIYDLKGYTIYPGFIDPFTEYGIKKSKKLKKKDNLKFKATRIGGNAANDAFHSEVNWVDTFIPDLKESEGFFKEGVTIVQSARKDGIFRGRSFVAILGEGLPNDLLLIPYSHHFCSFNKGTSQQENPNSLMGSIALIRQTFYDVDWYFKAHNAYKLNPDQKMPEFNSSIEALANYKKEKIIFETDNELSLLRANNIAREFNLDFIHIGSGYEYARLNEIKKTGVKLILPLNFPKPPNVKSVEDEFDITLADLRHWETAPANASFLEKNNIPFAFTTHRLKDKSDFLKNIRKTIKHGLSQKTALAALTIIPAGICGISHIAGTLEKGKLANFFICNGNIFEEEAAIFSVWVKGKKNELTVRPEIDYRGEYLLKFSDIEVPLSLKGKIYKITGEIKIDEKTIKLKNISTLLEKLQFSFKLDTFGIDGVIRFSGRKEKDTISGVGLLPDGSEINWTAIQSAPYKPDEKNEQNDKDKSQKKPEKLISKITFPNKAYGFTELPRKEDILIKDATVWTSEKEGILKNTDILVINSKFARIGQNIKAPSNIKIIDAAGKHITAGIIDEHSHIAISGNVNECTDAITAEVRIGDVVNSDDINIYRELTGGVTVTQSLHGSCNAIGGQCQIIKLRWGANPEDIKFKEAPPTIKFALGENVKRSGWGDKYNTRYPQTRMGIETIIRDEFQAAIEYQNEWNKYNTMSKREKLRTIPPRKNLELDAIVDVLNSRSFIHCHSYVQTEILMLMRLAEEFNFKVQNFTHILEGYKVADEMAQHGTTASAFSDWWAYKFEVYDAIPYNINLMTEKGVISSVNSDNADLARRLNQEAAKSIMYGNMTQEEAIKLATINPAIQLKVEDRVGSIKVGKDADFVIWNDNPLSIYAKVEQTWIEGRKYFDIERDEQLRKEQDKEKYALIQKVLSTKEDKSTSREGYKPKDKEWQCDDNLDYWRRINNEK